MAKKRIRGAKYVFSVENSTAAGLAGAIGREDRCAGALGRRASTRVISL